MLMQFFSFLFFGGGRGGGAQIRCIVGNVEVAYRRLSVVLHTVYNFYLRHVV